MAAVDRVCLRGGLEQCLGPGLLIGWIPASKDGACEPVRWELVKHGGSPVLRVDRVIIAALLFRVASPCVCADKGM